ncbi:MAG TPA: cysteine rich repeat-containing protein [Acidiferrobacterales bacterium]|nr:cysteine rich repeat-containing protein [Acidiferrobacterales bacterium]
MNSCKKIVSIALSVTLLAFYSLTPIASAQEGPCAADAKKLCKDVQPGGGRIAQCMKQHETELSQACKDQMQTMKAEMEKNQQACKGDAEKLCKGVEPGGGRIARCLKENEQQVSSECKKTIQEAKSKHGEPKKK